MCCRSSSRYQNKRVGVQIIDLNLPHVCVYRKPWSRLWSLLSYSFLCLSVNLFDIGVLSVVIGYVIDLYCLTFSIMVKRLILDIVLCPFSFGHCIVCPSIYSFLLPLFVSSNFSYVRTRHWIVILIHKLYVSRYELQIPSKEYKRMFPPFYYMNIKLMIRLIAGSPALSAAWENRFVSAYCLISNKSWQGAIIW